MISGCRGSFSHLMRTMSVAMKYDVNALALSFGASSLPLGSSLNPCCIDWWCHWSFLLLSHKLASAIASDSQLCHLLWSKGHCCLKSSEPDSGFHQDHWSSQHLFPWRGHEGLPSVRSQLCHIRTTYLELLQTAPSTVFLLAMLDVSGQPMYSQDVPSNCLEFLFSSHHPRPWAEPRGTQVASALSLSPPFGV